MNGLNTTSELLIFCYRQFRVVMLSAAKNPLPASSYHQRFKALERDTPPVAVLGYGWS